MDPADQTGGIVLATVGSWANGAGLAKVTVNDDGTAEGRIIAGTTFMQARSQAAPPLTGDLSARTAYADSERDANYSAPPSRTSPPTGSSRKR